MLLFVYFYLATENLYQNGLEIGILPISLTSRQDLDSHNLIIIRCLLYHFFLLLLFFFFWQYTNILMASRLGSCQGSYFLPASRWPVYSIFRYNKMNCELMLTYDTPAYMLNSGQKFCALHEKKKIFQLSCCLKKKILNEKKTHNPLQVKWLVP